MIQTCNKEACCVQPGPHLALLVAPRLQGLTILIELVLLSGLRRLGRGPRSRGSL
jgi:hypothetical protein